MTGNENLKIILGRQAGRQAGTLFDSLVELSVFVVAIINSIERNIIRSYAGFRLAALRIF